MKYAVSIILLIHGLIHLLGFVKGYGLREVKELSLPISKSMSLLWLAAALVLVIYSIFHLLGSRYSWIIGFTALVISQALIVLYWKDARWGTLPNVLILLLSIVSYAKFSFHRQIAEERSQLLEQVSFSSERVLTKEDIQLLPLTVQNWLQRSGAVGKPFIHVGRVTQEAKMKMKPEQEHWYSARAIQYTTADVPGFIWSVDVDMNSVLNFQGRDRYENGKGEMLIKMNSLITVVNEQGEKLDEGTLQRYLGEIVWFPSLALSSFISWQEVDQHTAIATMDYKGVKGSGTFRFNDRGELEQFSALRFKGNDTSAKRYEWILSVQEHRSFEGIRIPSLMTATWRLDDQDWTWLKLKVTDLRFNERALK